MSNKSLPVIETADDLETPTNALREIWKANEECEPGEDLSVWRH